ncbi:MAG: SHOCT domain-containing protein [Defluviitaleaceae bacterium]|nr:SHOCT domain-containing protein [Defluviitaleaceae bacterium]
MSYFTPAKNNVGILTLANNDSRLGQVKVFDKAIMTPIAISENGYIAIYQAGGRKALPTFLIPKFEEVPEMLNAIHISDVNSVDLLTDNKSGLGGAVLGGLIAGGGGMVVGQALSSGKIKSIDLQIKTSDFNNPQIIVPLYRAETVMSALAKDPFSVISKAIKNNLQQREAEIMELMSQLDNIYHTYKNSQITGTAPQQMSDADELAKYKKLLDDGIITQAEFNAKKKQIFGLVEV